MRRITTFLTRVTQFKNAQYIYIHLTGLLKCKSLS